jgi:LytTr DNA-binding domain
MRRWRKDADGMNGEWDVMNKVPWQAYALAAVGPLIFCFINIWSRLHDQVGTFASTNSWEIIAWEATSATVTIFLLPLVAIAVYRGGLPQLAGWWKWTHIHLVAAALFFVLHVSSFILLRHMVYAAFGSIYSFGGLDSWIYELPKDVVTYVISAAIICSTSTLLVVNSTTQAEDRITIREGTRSYFVRSSDIVAISAAGNYAEFKLADGRTPLMRTTLSALEQNLGDHGMVRTHRSWLVNPKHVTEISPTGGGDYRVMLQSGFEASLSRRYSNALNLIRPGGIDRSAWQR